MRPTLPTILVSIFSGTLAIWIAGLGPDILKGLQIAAGWPWEAGTVRVALGPIVLLTTLVVVAILVVVAAKRRIRGNIEPPAAASQGHPAAAPPEAQQHPPTDPLTDIQDKALFTIGRADGRKCYALGIARDLSLSNLEADRALDDLRQYGLVRRTNHGWNPSTYTLTPRGRDLYLDRMDQIEEKLAAIDEQE